MRFILKAAKQYIFIPSFPIESKIKDKKTKNLNPQKSEKTMQIWMLTNLVFSFLVKWETS